MNDNLRKWLADKLANTANIIIAGFIIGQLISDKPFNVIPGLNGSTFTVPG